MTTWDQWCLGVIAGMGEPQTQVSVDTHWAWSNAETAPENLMRWNNPQNTTQKWYVNGIRVSRDSGAQPGPNDVQIYPSVEIGIEATVFTLNNGDYPAICDNLRAGVPRQQWGMTSAAGAELHLWGTGTLWLTEAPFFGPPPILFTGGFDMATFEQWVNVPVDANGNFTVTWGTLENQRSQEIAQIQKSLADLSAAVAALSQQIANLPGGSAPELTTITLSIPSVPGTATGKITP